MTVIKSSMPVIVQKVCPQVITMHFAHSHKKICSLFKRLQEFQKDEAK